MPESKRGLILRGPTPSGYSVPVAQPIPQVSPHGSPLRILGALPARTPCRGLRRPKHSLRRLHAPNQRTYVVMLGSRDLRFPGAVPQRPDQEAAHDRDSDQTSGAPGTPLSAGRLHETRRSNLSHLASALSSTLPAISGRHQCRFPSSVWLAAAAAATSPCRLPSAWTRSSPC